MIIDQLVFGSARLTGGASSAGSKRLVRACLHGGITRFDTAPSYGLGTAELVIGQSLGSDAAAQIATKVGSDRPSHPVARTWLRAVKGLIRPGTSPLAVPLSPGAAVSEPVHHAFTPEQMARSLEQSRRALRRDTLDLLLLHDIAPSQVTPGVIDFMLRARCDGLANEVGHATGGLANHQLVERFPANFIVQAAASPEHLLGTTVKVHTSILHSIARTAKYLEREDPIFAERLGRIANLVPPDKADKISARLAAAYVLVHVHNPECKLIFATTHADRLEAFLRAINVLSAAKPNSLLR